MGFALANPEGTAQILVRIKGANLKILLLQYNYYFAQHPTGAVIFLSANPSSVDK